MDRRWRVQPDQAYQITEEEYIGVVSREALTEAILDGIPLLDRAGGVLTVIVGRTKTGYPGEAVTTGAAIQWKSGPRVGRPPPHPAVSFRTIETMVPGPSRTGRRLLYLPRQEQWADNVQAVRLLIDAQQENIDIDLPFQAVMRSGRIYGLGVGKAYWRHQEAPRRRVKPKMMRSGYAVSDLRREVIFDDPTSRTSTSSTSCGTRWATTWGSPCGGSCTAVAGPRRRA
jgi:hypothetical protein